MEEEMKDEDIKISSEEVERMMDELRSVVEGAGIRVEGYVESVIDELSQLGSWRELEFKVPDSVSEMIAQLGQSAIGLDLVKKAMDAAGFAVEHQEEILSVIKAGLQAAPVIRDEVVDLVDQVHKVMEQPDATVDQVMTTIMTETLQVVVEIARIPDVQPILYRALSELLGYEVTQTDLIPNIALDLITGYVTHALSISGYTQESTPGVEFALSVLAAAMGQDTWDAFRVGIIYGSPAIDALAGGGFSLASALFGLAKYFGLATSSQAPTNTSVVWMEDAYWTVTSIGNVTIALFSDLENPPKSGTYIRILSAAPSSPVARKVSKYIDSFTKSIKGLGSSISAIWHEIDSLVNRASLVQLLEENKVANTLSGKIKDLASKVPWEITKRLMDSWVNLSERLHSKIQDWQSGRNTNEVDEINKNPSGIGLTGHDEASLDEYALAKPPILRQPSGISPTIPESLVIPQTQVPVVPYSIPRVKREYKSKGDIR